MKAPIYSQSGEKKGEVTLNSKIFGVEMNLDLVHQYMLLQEANGRNAIAHVKTRAEIRGGGRKPHRQKGTGRARLGSIRTPQQRGGGRVFGPRSVRNFTVMMPKKQRRKALFCTLSDKAKNNHILVLDEYTHEAIQTKMIAEMIGKLPIKRNVLIVIPEKNEVIQKSSRNLTNAKTILADYLNPRDLLKYESVLFLKDALNKIEELFLEKKSAKN